MARPLSVTVLRCRTSDRTHGGARGAESLGLALDPHARLVGLPGTAHIADWSDDLRDSHGCLLEAGGQVADMLDAGAFPVLTSSDCSICMTTFQAVVRHEPAARVLWLDAHGDFNSPDTTPSGFLGGMCLAAACGRWDAGFEPALDPSRVLMCGVRDLDPGERVLVETAGVPVARPSEVVERLRGVPRLRAPRPRRARPRHPALAVPGRARAERHRPAHAAGGGRPRLRCRRRGDHRVRSVRRTRWSWPAAPSSSPGSCGRCCHDRQRGRPAPARGPGRERPAGQPAGRRRSTA